MADPLRAAESAVSLTGPGRSRVAIWAALGTLVAGFAAVDVVFSPLGHGADVDQNPGGLIGAALLMGALVAQPILAAIVTVFWPARDIVRVAAGVTLAFLMVYAFVLGEPRPRPNSLFSPAWMYLMFLVPLVALRWLRGWRIISPLARSAQHDRRFNLRTLLVIVTLACALLAAGRWVVATVQWPNDRAMLLATLESTAIFGCVGALVFLVIVPGIAWALADERRQTACLATHVGVLVVTIGSMCLEAGASAPGQLQELVLIHTGLAGGAFGSILLALFVWRWCGFRLVRQTCAPRLPAGGGLAAAPAAAG